jgi:HPt (histidine-containing phosphotransfer) domain-containing protein
MFRVNDIADEHGIDPQDAIELLHEFLRYTAEESLPAIRAGLAAVNPVGVKHAAHSIKGAALNLKLDQTAALARQIEETAASNLDGVPVLADQIAEHLSLLRAFLDQHSL